MSDNSALSRIRAEIDGIDEEIVKLLGKRANLALEVAKAKQGAAVYRPTREVEVIKHVLRVNDSPLLPAALTAIYREIIAGCRTLQQPFTVAYLGPEGTYTEEAARTQFGESGTYLPLATLDEVVTTAEKGSAQVAVVPVENSTEGSVVRTLDLLVHTTLRITGEITLPIHHQLLSHAKSLKDITEVSGHPQALAQCREWLAKHVPHATLVPASSNAEAAQGAQNPVSTHCAAIAGTRASDIYHLPVLAQNIEDSSTNTTRFLMLSDKTATAAPTGSDKTSLVCSTPNKPGTLHKLLAVLAEAGINMTKLESRPSPSALWDYVFFIDIDGHEQDEPIGQALEALHTQAVFVKVLGSYPKGA